MDNRTHIKNLKKNITMLENTVEYQKSINNIYELLNKKDINDKLQDNRIELIEKDISILSEGQKDIKQCTDTLTRKIESLDKRQASQSIIIKNTHDTINNFIDTHKDDAKDAVRWMSKIVWSIISATLIIGGFIIGFIGYQNNTIQRVMDDKFEMMQEFYSEKQAPK